MRRDGDGSSTSLPGFRWICVGALLSVGAGLVSTREAIGAIGEGLDVYEFLVGMMLLSEVARLNGLFQWLAGEAVRLSRGSAKRLFWLVYGAGTVVTIFLSNDATAVVLTPAVCALAAAAEVSAVPYVLACAFTANAASFVLPISNPANLVLHLSQPPSLLDWLGHYFLPSVASVGLTGLCLYWTQRETLNSSSVSPVSREFSMPSGARMVAYGIGIAAIVMLLASGQGYSLGRAALLVALGTHCVTSVCAKRPFLEPFGSLSWSVVPLVAALFVLTRAVENLGFLEPLRGLAEIYEGGAAPWVGGLALLCNIGNNLPVGMLVSSVLQQTHGQLATTLAVIVVDLSPNLSVTGSLATLLWLQILRSEGVEMSFLKFLKVGVFVMPFALVGAVLAAYV